ncbi:MAG: hypothetical protein K2Y37_10195 [Pirellulales bacterium]|nr:hypothetical protein [Pirellulales bacterium]
MRWGDNNQPAIAGLLSSGETVVLVDRSGQLRFEWTCRETKAGGKRWDYSLELPPAAASQLSVLVPASREAAISAGLLSAGVEEESVGRWWHAALGPLQHVELRVRESRDQTAAASTFVRQVMRYEATSRGIEVGADLEFESHQWPLDEFEFVADPGFELLEVRLGGEPARNVSSHRRDDGYLVCSVNGIAPGVQARQVLQITGTARLDHGNPQSLPAIRPNGAVWLSGKTVLTIRAPLWLESLDLADCRQVGLASLPPPSLGEAYDFEWFDPMASIQARLSPVKSRWKATMGSRLEINDSEVVGHTTLQLQADVGEVFLIETDVGRSWLIDAVAMVPPDALGDWTFEPQDSAKPELRIRLARALRPNEPLTLVVSGRRPRWSTDQPFDISELAMVSLPGHRQERVIVNVRTSPPLRVESSRDTNRLRLEPGSLTPLELELIGGEPDGLLLAMSPDSGELPLALHTGAPTLTAAINVLASLGDNEVSEHYELACTPQRTRLRRIWVRFSQPRAESLTWSLENDPSTFLDARLLSRDEQRGLGLPPGGEVWEVALPRPTGVPFKLVGARRSKAGAVTAISLVSVLEADQQAGRVEVQSIDAQPIELLAPRLRGLSLEKPSGKPRPDIVAAFEYAPQVDADPTAAPAISLLRKPENAGRWPAAIVLDCQLQSQVAIDGTSTHVASYEIEHSGLKQFRLLLPSAYEVVAVWGDGQRRVARQTGDLNLTIDLPSGAGRTRLVIEMRSRLPQAPGLWTRLTAPMPAPVDTRVRLCAPQWSLTLPSGFTVLSKSPVWVASDRAAGWRERLFGSLARATAHDGTDSTGANDVELQAATAESAATTPVTVANVTKLRALAWTGFWLVASLTWLLRPSTRFCAGASGLLAIIALAIPAPYWLLMSPLWMAVLAGKLGSQWRSKSATAESSARRSPGRPVELASTARFVMLAVAAGAAIPGTRFSATAAEPIDTAVPSVLIPARDGQQPSGDPYLVPEGLWSAMRRTAGELDGHPTGWLLANGQYRIALDWTPDGQRLRLARVKACYDLHVFTPDSRVALAIGDARGGESFRVSLDGQRVATFAGQDRQTIAIVVSRPDSYRLEIELDGHQSPESTGMSWVVPALPCAEAQIELPPDAPPIECDAATGTLSSNAGQQSIVAPLGGQSRLAVRWPHDTRQVDATLPPEIEQLTWVSLQPGAVVIQVRFRLPSAAGSELIRVETADDLRPLPFSDESRPLPGVERVGAARQILTVPLVSKSDGTAVAELNLLAERSSGIGRLAAPWIVPLHGRVSRRWLAVSVVGNLDIAESNIAGYRIAPNQEFVTAWGDNLEPPLRAYLQHDSNESNWLIVGRPHPAQKIAQTSLTCEYGRRQVQVQFTAKIQALGGSVLRHEIQVPHNLELDSVLVTAGHAARRARWSLTDDGRLTVILASPLTGDHIVSFSGSLASPDVGEHALAVVWLKGADVRSAHVTVLRTPQVQLALTAEQDLRPLDESMAVDVQSASESRVVASYEANQPTYQARVVVAPNHPEITATTTTVVGRRNGVWLVEWRADYEVAHGSLDRFHVWLPPEVSEAIEVNPAAEFSISPGAGEQRKLLTVVPSESVDGRYRLELRARLLPRGAQRLLVPAIEATDAQVLEQYLVLPGRDDGKTINWQTRGLARVETPAGANASLWSLAGPLPLPHRVLADSFEAGWQIAVDAGTPQVRIAGYSITLLPTGNLHGMATFDLDPAERRYLPLTVPEGCEILWTWVERVPGQVIADGPNRYRVLLHTAQLPQRVEVFFRGQVQNRGMLSSARAIAAPSPGDLPVERTLWQVRDAGYPSSPRQPAGQSLAAAPFESVRASSLSAVVETLCESLPERLQADEIDAAAGWLERLRSARDRAHDAANTASVDERQDLASQLEVVQQAIERLSARLPKDPNAAAGEPPKEMRVKESEPIDVPALAIRGEISGPATTDSLNSLRAVFHGRHPILEFRLHRSGAVTWLPTTVLAAIALLGMAGLLLSGIGEWVGNWLLARPAVVGALVGLVWATCLAGAWLGVALVTVCVAIWLRKALRTSRTEVPPADLGSEARLRIDLA